MSETVQPNLLRKLRMTPWRDLLRFRLSGRLDVAARIHSADLPDPVKSLITRIIRRTRLWKSEKLDVADELLAHFADGLEAGVTIEKLIEKFGDERQAGKLIRRGKLRNRPIAWRATAAIVRAMEVFFAFYLLLAAWFFTGHPSPKVDYLAIVDQKALSIPEGNRAWPMYHKIMEQTRDYNPPDDFNRSDPDELRPGRKGWPWLSGWLRSHSAALSLARQAAALPALGYAYAPEAPRGYPELNFLDKYLIPMGRISFYLSNDAELAIEDRDPNRFDADITAILQMADQLRGEASLVSGFTGVELRHSALDEINSVLTSNPAFLRDSDLQAIAHQISRFGDAADMFNLQGEQFRVEDFVQNTYTEGGIGNGRLTPEGVKLLRSWGPFEVFERTQVFALGPAIMLLTSSRQDINDRFGLWERLAEADLHTPLRDLPQSSADNFLRETKNAGWPTFRYELLAEQTPGINGLRRNAEVLLGARDGIEVALALEAYHRRHGQYPATLQQLVPTLLPAIPPDRITGDPVKYRLFDGRPIIYSVGVDRKDDGGRAPIYQGQPENFIAARWPESDQARQKIPDGDWILYPFPRDDN